MPGTNSINTDSSENSSQKEQQLDSETDHTWTAISYNRPLTRQARRALSDYEILDERHPEELNRWSEVDVDERPPDELLEEHELRLEDPTGGKEPNAVYESPSGDRVEVFDGEVFTNGSKSTVSPDEATEVAEKNDWKQLCG